MTDLHIYFRIGLSTISSIIKQVCKLIWETLRNAYLRIPDVTEWKIIAKGFENNANFPNCIGALDGKHIRLIKPQHSGSMFYNYKNFFSLVLLAMCDTNYLFTFVDIGAYGKESDSSIFKKSALFEAIKTNQLHFPAAAPIGESDRSVNFWRS